VASDKHNENKANIMKSEKRNHGEKLWQRNGGENGVAAKMAASNGESG
jgi:hypothetical protein